MGRNYSSRNQSKSLENQRKILAAEKIIKTKREEILKRRNTKIQM